MPSPHYPIHLHWNEEDGEWFATWPAWLALSALAKSPGAAGDQLEEAIQLGSSANGELGRTVPESLTVADLKLAGSLLKITTRSAVVAG